MKPEKIATWTFTAILSITFYVILTLGTWFRESFPGATVWAHWLGWFFAVLGLIIITGIFCMSTYGRKWLESKTLTKKEGRENILKSYKTQSWWKYFSTFPISIFILITYFHMGWYALFTVGCISTALHAINYFTLNDYIKTSLKISKVVELE